MSDYGASQEKFNDNIEIRFQLMHREYQVKEAIDTLLSWMKSKMIK